MVDMELYWEIVSYIADMVLMGMTGYLFYRFTKPFLSRDSHGGVIGVTYFIVITILYLVPWEMSGTAAYAVGVLAAFAAMYLIDRRNTAQKLFLATVMYLVEWMTAGIAVILRDTLFEVIINPPYIVSRPMLQFGCYVAVEIIYVVLYFFIMAFFFSLIDKVYVYKKENMTKMELGLLMSIPLSVLAGRVLFKFFSEIYLSDTEQYIWTDHEEYLWLIGLYQIVSYLAIIATIAFYQNIREGHRKEKENAVLSEQIESMKGHISKVETLYKDIRGLKHDMGNHVMTLENLFLKNEWQEGMDYLSKLKEQMSEAGTEIKTGNPVTDVILSEKQKEAEEKKIAFLCEFHYPQETKINAFDLSVILNNAVGNAIEAAEKCNNPYIHIKSWRKKNACMIEVSNSFAGKLILDEESGLPESTKNGQEHGFGLANIRKMAQKYQGDIDIEQKEGKFILSIMLMVE